MFTVGPLQENSYLVRAATAPTARCIVDPGDEAERLLGAIDDLGVTLDAILLTHTPLRPHRRRRAGRPRDGRAGLLPRARGRRCSRHHALRPVPGFGPFESWDARADRRRRRAPASSPASTSTCIFTPGHSPGHVTYAIADEQRAVQRRRALPGLRRARRPARRRLARRCCVDREAAGALRRRDAVYPGHMGLTTLGAERAHEPVPGRLARVCERAEAPGAARHATTCCPSDAPTRRASRRPRARSSSRAGYRRIETPTFEATELFARGVGEATDIVQKEMYTFEDGGGRSLTLRPEGTAPVCRAYLEHGMHKLAAAGEALVPVERSSARRSPRPGATGSSGRSGPRRSAPTTPPSTPSRSCCCTRCCGELGGRATCACASASSARPRRAPTTASSCTAYLRAHEDQLSEEVAARIDLNPLRAFDADHPGTREVMRGAPRLLDEPRRRRRRALRRGPRAARRGRRRATRSTRRSCAAWTTTRARSSSSPPTRWARSAASAAAGATTALVEHARRPADARAWAGPPGVERMLLAAGERRRRRRRRATSTSPTRTARRARPSRWPTRRARPGCAAQHGARRALAQGAAQAGRPGGRALRCHRGARGDTCCRTWNRRAGGPALGGGRGRRRPARAGAACEAAARPTAFATPGRARWTPRASATQVRVAGWVHRRRDHGGLIFIDLRDRSGLVQLVLHPDAARRVRAGRALRPEHVVTALGRSSRRDGAQRQPEHGDRRDRDRRERARAPGGVARRRRSRSTRTSRSTRCCACSTARSTCAAT